MDRHGSGSSRGEEEIASSNAARSIAVVAVDAVATRRTGDDGRGGRENERGDILLSILRGGGERRAIAQFVATGEGGGEPVSRRPR